MAEHEQRSISSTAVRIGLGILAGVSVAAVAGYALGVKPAEALTHLRNVPLGVVLLCCASAFVVLGLQSLRWFLVMKPLLGLPYSQAYRAQIVGVLFNAVLPARGGDLLRVQYLGRRSGKSRATILGTEIVDRWLDWWGWIPTFLVLAALGNTRSELWIAFGSFGGALAALGIAMVLVIRTKWLPKEGSKLRPAFQALRQGLEAFRSPRTWAIAFLIAPLPWIWEALVISQSGHSFGIDLTYVQAFTVLIAFNMATIAGTPGGIGTIEVGGTMALINFFHADQSAAMAFMFVYHFSQLLPGIGGGAAVLVAEGERLFGPVRELHKIEETLES